MNRRALVGAVLLLVLVGAGVGAAATTYIEPYTGPGVWFAAGQGRGSDYDGCDPWVGNNFAKAANAWGLVTFINTSGGWRYTVQNYGNLYRSIGDYWWRKKLHCKNNSSVGYQGGCWGDKLSAGQCA